MLDRRKMRELFGESIRELGILVLVFVPIDAFFQPAPVNRLEVAILMMGALLFGVWGIIIGSRA
jgi:hypothetical protein